MGDEGIRFEWEIKYLASKKDEVGTTTVIPNLIFDRGPGTSGLHLSATTLEVSFPSTTCRATAAMIRLSRPRPLTLGSHVDEISSNYK